MELKVRAAIAESAKRADTMRNQLKELLAQIRDLEQRATEFAVAIKAEEVVKKRLEGILTKESEA